MTGLLPDKIFSVMTEQKVLTGALFYRAFFYLPERRAGTWSQIRCAGKPQRNIEA
jgi:hypothetical protein